ncbi:hypothetical protein B0H11DRAFT_2019312 [Mycena galericulata]|nr:hypothetical protein B0H11DRAFT_2019312 [Mycena galericulata]
MDLSRLTSMPAELQLMTYYHFEYTDLLAVSYVSRFWRAVVLGDRRWAVWFEMITNPDSGERIRNSLARFNVLDAIVKHSIVTLCFYTKCSVCLQETANIFLPLLKRICNNCLNAEDHAVMTLSAALTAYDLKEQDATDVLTLDWEPTNPTDKKQSRVKTRARLVSKSVIKTISINKYGSETKLEAHLQAKKARLLSAYEPRLAEYTAAMNERKRLKAKGDETSAAAVTLSNGKPIPRARPQMHPILKNSSPPNIFRTISIVPTNFLTVEDGYMVAQQLLRCSICCIIADLRAEHLDGEPQYPDFMRSVLLPAHEDEQHHQRRYDTCRGTSTGSPCYPCLNLQALEIKDDLDRLIAMATQA